ncbi:hypothetical protein [Halorubellus salinus]|uniref:hypothetical protein n=1 Tax=Halorubellus salinus TaxID=755309 RepID=UPI001D06A660|nr:hypothetical protein [Halorubellus salinus]
MPFGSDDRAVAIQVGAIVLFAFVIIAITAYQASVVPNQNEQVEFNHNQEVQRQLADLQGAVGSTPTAGGARTVVVESSTGYPARTIFVNPPRPTGRLRTFGTGNPAFTIEIENAAATGETGDFWDGTTTQTYRSGGFVFDPNYNVYSEAPRTVVSNSLVYNQFPNGEDIVVNSQSLFDGRRISLTALNGSYDEQGGAASVTVRPVSASSTRVSVEGTSSNPVTISVVTRLGDSLADAATRWETILTEAGEMSGSGGYVDAVNPVGPISGTDAYRIEFVMDPSATYSLSLAKAGVGTNVNAEPADRYVTTGSAKNVSTTAGAKETLTVEVRDEFNNPLSGVEMDARVEWASRDEGSIVEPNGTETGDDGRVGFTYEAPDAKTDARVNVSLSNAAGKSTSVTFNVSVSKASGGGGGNGAYNVTLVKVSETNTPAGAVSCPNWPTNRTCVVDGSQLSTVNVTMGTSPTAVGASVSWAVNDTTIATVDPENGETQGNGENSTDVVLNQNGDVVVFASSGAGGNRTTLRVTGISAAMAQPGIVFTKSGELRTVGQNGVVKAYDPAKTGTVKAIGPMNADLDGDGKVEVPFVTGNNDLKMIDLDGQVQTLIDGASGTTAKQARIGVGTYRGSGPYVYFVNGNDNLHRVDGNGNAQVVYTNIKDDTGTISAQAVAGTASFSGGQNHIVFVAGDGNVKHLKPQNKNKNTIDDTTVAPSSVHSISDPSVDITANEGIVYRASSTPWLYELDSNGQGDQLSPADKPVGGAPIAMFDYTGDNVEDVIYVGQSGYLRYVTTSGATGYVRDEDGNRISAASGIAGVA